MTHRRRPAAGRLLALLLAVLPAAGCEAPREHHRRYEDLLTSGRLPLERLSEPPHQVSCGDETHFALSLQGGDELAVEVALGEAPRLVLTGCTRRWRRRDEVAELQVAVRGRAGEVDEVVETLPVLGQEGWWTREVDLAALASQQAKLALTLRLPPGQRLHLRDVYLEHQVPLPHRDPAARQVLLISVDTLRADAVGPSTTPGGTSRTPALDQLAAAAQVWSPHYAAASWTQPSHAVLLTGYSHVAHGAEVGPLHPGLPTLAERLRGAGFATYGLVHDCVWLDPKFGFDRGFDHYRAVKWQLEQMGRELANWLGDHRDRSFFAFFHTFEPHSDFYQLPYESPGTGQRQVAESFGVADYGCAGTICASARLRRIQLGELAPLPGEAEILRELYGRSVAQVDRQLGQLFDHLRHLGLFEQMTIVVTSDHGELLLEDGRVLHGSNWQPVLQVPLIVKWPGGRFAGEQRQQLSSALDLVPTLLDAYGLDPGDLEGRPLLQRRADLPAFASSVGTHVVWHGRFKAVFEPATGQQQLFDLEADPAERHDLATQLPAELARLRQLSEQHRERAERLHRGRAAATDLLTEEDRERLRALGYLGG